MFTGVAEYRALREGANRLELEFYEVSDACFDYHGRNRHPFHRLFAVVEGDGGSTIFSHTLNSEVVMLPGRVCFMTAGNDLEFHFRSGTRFYAFHFGLACGGIDIFTGADMLDFRDGRSDFIIAIAPLFAGEADPSALCVLKGMVLREVAAFLVGRPFPDAELARLRPALDFIRNHAVAGTTVTELAELCNCSADSFSRSFSRQTGISAKRWLNRELARRAGRLLRGSDLRIKEIAAELGFDDVAYFSRFFRRETGVPPTQFRLHPERNGRR